MKVKNLISYLIMLAITAFVVVSCSDDFTEEDFLRLQSDLADELIAEQQAREDSVAKRNREALEAAGILQSFTVQVQEDETPLAGATVVISNPSGGESTATTNANGNAVFSDIVIGSNTINVSLANYVSAQAIVDMGPVANGTHYTTDSDGNIIVIPTSESIIFPLFSEAGATQSTATITGTVTIESDLTNGTPEIPQNIEVRADLTNFVTGLLPSGGVTVNNYTFNSLIGTATVDNSNGAYTLLVPASAAGSQIQLLLPEINLDQTIAVNQLDSDPFQRRIITVPTKFEANALVTPGTVPTVLGADAVFTAPQAAGSGFAIGSFTPRGRALEGGPIANTTVTEYGDINYQITNRGSGYTDTPDVTISGGAGTGADLRADIEGIVTGVTVANVGTAADWTNGQTITADVIKLDDTGAQNGTVAQFQFDATASGQLPATLDINDPAVVTIVNLGGGDDDDGFVYDNPISLDEVTNGFVIVLDDPGTSGNGSITVQVDMFVKSFTILDGGSGFTSAPTFTVEAPPAGGTTAAFQIVDFATEYFFTLDNSGSAGSYGIVPDVSFRATTLASVVDVQGITVVRSTGETDDFGNIENELTISSGNVVFDDATVNSVFVNLRTVTAPTPIIVSKEPDIDVATLDITADGKIAGFDQDPIVDGVSGDELGEGYNSAFTVTVTPVGSAPGTGAVIQLDDFTINGSGEYQWSGQWTSISEGSGYLDNINQDTDEAFSGNLTPTIQSGQTIVIDFKYGTGVQQIQVD